MSILIKGMEMPTKENAVILITPSGDVWMIGNMPNEDTHLVKAQAVPVPLHGRLIDADALKDKEYNSGMWANGHDGFRQMVIDVEDIYDAPTIIEAEKELDFSGMSDENDSYLDFSGLDSAEAEGTK